MTFSRITGTGGHLPEKVLTNRDLESIVETSDQWIVERTGIRQRHIAAEDESTSDLALHACRRALEMAGRSAADVDLIIVATSTPDMVFPSSACLLQAKLGVTRGAAFDVQAVCSGFTYALATADLFIRSGAHRCALVVGAEVFSRILDWKDRGTCVLFGDGAGAVLLEASDKQGIIASELHADGRHAAILNTPGTVNRGSVLGDPTLKMDGTAVFRLAVRVLEESARSILAANKLTLGDLDAYIAHQANVRIISHVGKKLGLDNAKCIVTVDQHANTSAASIPLALDVAVRDGRVKPGHLVLLQGVGGGFTWGSVLLRY
ncbi:beta-ketoacyl-ACP synthase III [Usitatibacter palustris]|uniref:Beta-ketoacyl-[acyl-carrier-protein] synthase III n=1 Tax=Usitatibacter palustris TaxID=2732487 RepID=A0A6M4H6Q8_9PROT|nr:beta-ketoacyl-ACP synthase III [Usitatibacter palustris]QJR15210.1 3-oxoacyl-[acyl-carrier-protein] synthase 3 [Usitatibacter palustris]